MAKKAEKTKYTENELKEFEGIILEKMESAQGELDYIKGSLLKSQSGNTLNSNPSKVMEDGAETMEREKLSQLAIRQKKFIENLKNALIRIKNGTYGVCSKTGKLIPADRLRAVPHTTQSVEAKLNQIK